MSKELERIALRIAREKSGLEVPGESEFENLYIDDVQEQKNGNRTVFFRYVFDQDGFSQYDKTISFKGQMVVDTELRVIESNLILNEIGVAAHYDPPEGLDWIKGKTER
jgi:hypothetical protein